MSNKNVTPYSVRMALRVPTGMAARIMRLQDQHQCDLTTILTGLLQAGLDDYDRKQAQREAA